jgi:hypothetical protein
MSDGPNYFSPGVFFADLTDRSDLSGDGKAKWSRVYGTSLTRDDFKVLGPAMAPTRHL